MNNKSNQIQKYNLGKLSAQEIKKIKENTSLDVRKYKRVIDSYGIKHALKKHGKSAKVEKIKN